MQTDKNQYIKGRGAQINPANPYHLYEPSTNGLIWHDEDEINAIKRTEYLETHPKTILNKVDSPDIGMSWSLNPYQGCEHGCIYCYARNTHTFWGYSAGIEFEQKILVKKNAPQLLEQKIKSKTWKPLPIMLSGNTDCYQPAEKKYRLTREMLEILWNYRHPTAIITKSVMILRDIDILSKMAEYNLVHISISLTTLDEAIRLKLEPRTSSSRKRLDTIHKLQQAGIPVNVMFAPVIPSLNDSEYYQIAKASSEAGATSLNYALVRLNGDIAEIFSDWLQKNFPKKYKRILKQIESCHGGRLSDSRFGIRMRGEGNIADMIRQQIRQVQKKFFGENKLPDYNTDLYIQYRDKQLSLF